MKQTKSNVNISNLRKLGSFAKPEVKVNFLKPNLKVNLWKSDSSLETLENPGVDAKAPSESDTEGSDNDSFHSDDFLTNSKSDEDTQLTDSLENIGPTDYVLPSCGIIASAPRLGSRSQSISSTDMSISIPVPAEGQDCPAGRSDCEDVPMPSADSTELEFAKPMDVYCQRFVQDAQSKGSDVLEPEAGSREPHHTLTQTSRNAAKKAEPKAEAVADIPSRPSKLDVQSSEPNPQLLAVSGPDFSKSPRSPGSVSGNHEPGLHTTPSPADGSGSRAVSPFAKIRSSMVQVANITQAGLTQGINFAVAKVQKSPAEPEALNEIKQKELREMFTQCQTRIIQI